MEQFHFKIFKTKPESLLCTHNTTEHLLKFGQKSAIQKLTAGDTSFNYSYLIDCSGLNDC